MAGATDAAGRLDRPLTARIAGLLFARLAQPLADNLVDQLESMGRQFHQRLVELEAERDRLQVRVAELEQRQMVYRGIWEEGALYHPGDVSTHAGTVWYAHEATTDRPGTSAAWQLMVKSR